MKLHRLMAVALAGLSPLLLGACGGDSEGVTQASSGPRVPSVGGNWRGDWTGSGTQLVATLAMTQTGDQVRGTLTVGTQENEIAGTVDAGGVLRFEGTDTDPTDRCVQFVTTRPHMALAEEGSELGGPLSWLGFDCDDRTPTFSVSGILELDRIL
jgi:hypothetical protein